MEKGHTKDLFIDSKFREKYLAFLEDATHVGSPPPIDFGESRQDDIYQFEGCTIVNKYHLAYLPLNSYVRIGSEKKEKLDNLLKKLKEKGIEFKDRFSRD